MQFASTADLNTFAHLFNSEQLGFFASVSTSRQFDL